MQSHQQAPTHRESLKPSETCSSLETIPLVSTQRMCRQEAEELSKIEKLHEEDDLTEQIINCGNQANDLEEQDISLQLLAAEWEQQ